jgi:hypothetical protein
LGEFKVVELVENMTVFHVAHNKNYVRREPLKMGQKIEVGKATNPFMGYYDKARTYSVKHGNTTQKIPALKFLREVNKGKIECADIARQAHKIANHYSMLSRELIMEEIRLQIAPTAPSRKTCLWVVDELPLAEYWSKKIGGTSQIVKLSLTGCIHRCDAKHLMNESEPLADTYAKAERYWLGQVSKDPLPEILFAGSATVTAENLQS